MEVVVPSIRVSRKNGLIPQEYNEAKTMKLKSTNDRRIRAFDYMLVQKNKVSQTYNKIHMKKL